MILVTSYNKQPVRITTERLNHIYRNHPEMQDQLEMLVETIKNPDLVTEGDSGELLAIKRYQKTPVSENKFLVVVYKQVEEMNSFVITAYFTRKYNSSRTILWKILS
jgi:hypothetical protein